MIYSIYISHKISLQKWPPFQEHQLKSWRQMAQVQGAAPVQAGTKPWGKSLVTRPSEPWEILGYPWLSDIFSQSFPLWHGRIDDSNGFNGFNDEIGSIIFFDRFKTSPVWRFHRPIIEACAKLHGTNMDRDRWHFGVSPCVYHTGG
jgi:hypothetical protein